jgi:hypothetical protein
MKTTIAAVTLAIAAAISNSAFADSTVVNTGKTYDVKVQYRIPGKVYGLNTEGYGLDYDTSSALQQLSFHSKKF